MKHWLIVTGALLSLCFLPPGFYAPGSAEAGDSNLTIIEATTPEDKTVGVDVDIPISITFSEEIDPSTLAPDSIYIYNLNNPGEDMIMGRIEYDAEAKTVFFFPERNLSYSTNYVITIEGGVRTVSGKALGSGYSWGFTTRNDAAGCGGA